MVTRIIIDIIVLILAVVIPWWLVLIIAFALLFYFNNYFEFIFYALIIDSIYGSPYIFVAVPYPITLSAIVVFLIIHSLKNKLIIYSQ